MSDPTTPTAQRPSGCMICGAPRFHDPIADGHIFTLAVDRLPRIAPHLVRVAEVADQRIGMLTVELAEALIDLDACRSALCPRCTPVVAGMPPAPHRERAG